MRLMLCAIVQLTVSRQMCDDKGENVGGWRNLKCIKTCKPERKETLATSSSRASPPAPNVWIIIINNYVLTLYNWFSLNNKKKRNFINHKKFEIPIRFIYPFDPYSFIRSLRKLN